MKLARALVGEGRKPPEKDGFYRTTPYQIARLLEREGFADPIWEPACGDGAISRVLVEAGREVASSDLIDRGYGQARVDFLLEPWARGRSIVTNPPFQLADEFVVHAHRLGIPKIALFLPVRYLEGQSRYREVWLRHPYARKHVFADRQTLWRGDEPDPPDTGGKIAFAWFIWDADYRGEPQTYWIPPEETRR